MNKNILHSLMLAVLFAALGANSIQAKGKKSHRNNRLKEAAKSRKGITNKLFSDKSSGSSSAFAKKEDVLTPSDTTKKLLNFKDRLKKDDKFDIAKNKIENYISKIKSGNKDKIALMNEVLHEVFKIENFTKNAYEIQTRGSTKKFSKENTELRLTLCDLAKTIHTELEKKDSKLERYAEFLDFTKSRLRSYDEVKKKEIDSYKIANKRRIQKAK